MGDRAARDAIHFRRGRRTPMRVGAALACAGMLLACSKSPPPASPPARGPGIGPVVGDDPMNRAQPAQPSEFQVNRAPGEQPTAAVQAEQAQEEAQKEKEQRDYPGELLARIANPVSCLAPRSSDDNARPITIGIAAQLMPSGALARTELSAADLSGAERACLTQRVGAVHLNGPIEGAPLGVHASLTLQPSAAKPGAAALAAPQQEAQDMGGPPPIEGKEGSTFLEPSPEAPEVPAAPPVQPSGEGNTP